MPKIKMIEALLSIINSNQNGIIFLLQDLKSVKVPNSATTTSKPPFPVPDYEKTNLNEK